MMYIDLAKKSQNFRSTIFIGNSEIRGLESVSSLNLDNAFELFLNTWAKRNQMTTNHVQKDLVTNSLTRASSKYPDLRKIFVLNTSFIDDHLISKLGGKDCLIFEMGNKVWKDLIKENFKNMLITLPSMLDDSEPITIRDNLRSISFAPAMYPYIMHTNINNGPTSLKELENIKSDQRSFKVLTAGKNLLERISIDEWSKVILPIALTRNVEWTLIGADKTKFYEIIKSLAITSEQKDRIRKVFRVIPYILDQKKLFQEVIKHSLMYKGMQRGSGTFAAICVHLGVPVYHCIGSDASIYIGTQYPSLEYDFTRISMKELLDSANKRNRLILDQKKHLNCVNHAWSRKFEKYINILLTN